MLTEVEMRKQPKSKTSASKPNAEIDRLQPVAGSPAKLECISIFDLKIDKEYQRSLSSKSAQTLIRNISLGWNWQMCQTLEVALRPDEEVLAKVQGNQEILNIRGQVIPLFRLHRAR